MFAQNNHQSILQLFVQHLRADRTRVFFVFNPLKAIFYSSVVLLIIFIFLRPFHLSEMDSTPFLIIIFGICINSILGYCVSFSLIEPYKANRWTNLKEYITFAFAFTIMGCLNNLNRIFFKHYLFPKLSLNLGPIIKGDYNWVRTFIYTFITGWMVYFILRNLESMIFYKRKNGRLNSPDELIKKKPTTQRDSQIIIRGKNKNETLTLRKDVLICFSSNGHYVDIFYICYKSDKLLKETFRSSLKDLELQVSKFPFLFRSHNSHIINMNLLIAVTGNTHQAYARLKFYPKNIPISKKKTIFMKNTLKLKKEASI